MPKVWVIAASPKEADGLAADWFGFESGSLANEALREIQRTAAPFYSKRLKVYARRTPEERAQPGAGR